MMLLYGINRIFGRINYYRSVTCRGFCVCIDRALKLKIRPLLLKYGEVLFNVSTVL